MVAIKNNPKTIERENEIAEAIATMKAIKKKNLVTQTEINFEKKK